MKTRIVKITSPLGNEHYQIEDRHWLWGWSVRTEFSCDHLGWGWDSPMRFSTLEDAEKNLTNDKTEVVKYF